MLDVPQVVDMQFGSAEALRGKLTLSRKHVRRFLGDRVSSFGATEVEVCVDVVSLVQQHLHARLHFFVVAEELGMFAMERLVFQCLGVSFPGSNP